MRTRTQRVNGCIILHERVAGVLLRNLPRVPLLTLFTGKKILVGRSILDMLAAHRSHLLLQVEMGRYDNRLKRTYKNRSRKLPQAPLSPVKVPNRPAKRKQWSGEQMTAAMEAVTDGTAVSINQV